MQCVTVNETEAVHEINDPPTPEEFVTYCNETLGLDLTVEQVGEAVALPVFLYGFGKPEEIEASACAVGLNANIMTATEGTHLGEPDYAVRLATHIDFERGVMTVGTGAFGARGVADAAELVADLFGFTVSGRPVVSYTLQYKEADETIRPSASDNTGSFTEVMSALDDERTDDNMVVRMMVEEGSLGVTYDYAGTKFMINNDGTVQLTTDEYEVPQLIGVPRPAEPVPLDEQEQAIDALTKHLSECVLENRPSLDDVHCFATHADQSVEELTGQKAVEALGSLATRVDVDTNGGSLQTMLSVTVGEDDSVLAELLEEHSGDDLGGVTPGDEVEVEVRCLTGKNLISASSPDVGPSGVDAVVQHLVEAGEFQPDSDDQRRYEFRVGDSYEEFSRAVRALPSERVETTQYGKLVTHGEQQFLLQGEGLVLPLDTPDTIEREAALVADFEQYLRSIGAEAAQPEPSN